MMLIGVDVDGQLLNFKYPIKKIDAHVLYSTVICPAM